VYLLVGGVAAGGGLYGEGPRGIVGGGICAYCCCAGGAACGAYAFAMEDGLGGGAVVSGELTRGGAGPLGGGGGGVGVALAPYGFDGGAIERFC
jgi:hypothetical protein